MNNTKPRVMPQPDWECSANPPIYRLDYQIKTGNAQVLDEVRFV
jgi:hypothetical protein